MTVTDTENGKLFVLSKDDDAYDIIGDYVERYWENNVYEEVIVDLSISYDGRDWVMANDLACPNFTDVGMSVLFEHDWWEGEKHLLLRGIMALSDVDIPLMHGIYEKEVDTK